MVLIRYTFNGEGIFRAMQLFDKADMTVADEQDLYDAERPFEEYMSVPDVCTIMGDTKSYFTEKGEKFFLDSLETISFYFENYFGDLGKVEKEVIRHSGEVLYQDCYQVVLPSVAA